MAQQLYYNGNFNMEDDESVASSMDDNEHHVQHVQHLQPMMMQESHYYMNKRPYDAVVVDNSHFYSEQIDPKAKRARSNYKFDRVFECLSRYKATHGDLKVPVRYCVAHGDPQYPEDLWGMKIGKTLHHIRCHSYYAEHHDRLVELGVSFEVKRLNSVGFEVIYAALVAYKNIFGNLNVPQKYVIPCDDSNFPAETWGLSLGQRYQSMRTSDTYSEHKDRLVALGVEYLAPAEVITLNGVQMVKRRVNTDIERIIESIQAFKLIYGHVKVPKRYVVPKDDLRFPVHCWGLQLGNSIHHIRCHKTHLAHRDRLLALGIEFAVKAKVSFESIFEALKVYKMTHGDLHVPKRFSVPMGDESYPRETWGLKLGNTVSNIRNAQAFNEHREALMSLGLVYSNK